MRDLCTPGAGGRALRRGHEKAGALFDGGLGSSRFEKLLLAEDHGGYLYFEAHGGPGSKYKLTSETIEHNGQIYPIARYVPPAAQG